MFTALGQPDAGFSSRFLAGLKLFLFSMAYSKVGLSDLPLNHNRYFRTSPTFSPRKPLRTVAVQRKVGAEHHRSPPSGALQRRV
jgi:hypothetical protein